MSMTIWLIKNLLITVLLLCGLCQSLQAAAADDAAALRKKYEAIKPQLGNNQFHRELQMDSKEYPSTISGEVYAVMNYSFAIVNSALNDSGQGLTNWCDVLTLHANIKYCSSASSSKSKSLVLYIGKNTEQLLATALPLKFNYRVVASGPEYFQVALNAGSGPMGTSDYRIVLEAVAIDGKRTFLHLSYSYGYGRIALLAMKVYLATIGRSKVGFTRTGSQSKGQPVFIGGLRGMVERNTMRYYLAINAYLGTLSVPADKRLERRLTGWFGLTEQYARQLHDVEWEEYMQMKYHEYNWQQGSLGK